MSTLLLGRFELHEPLGKGGMGRVLRAVHRPDGASVAVKVMTAAAASEPDFRSDFRAEVRAVASLDHPAIVRVLDHGEIDEAAAARSRGELRAHTPWLAMELASGGTFDRWASGADVLSWPDLCSVLLTILDGLAHAHARGFLHLDLKPGNLLVCSPNDPRPGLKISDFGLAQRYEMSPGEVMSAGDGHVAGTPWYMAPEQIEGLRRDLGPWTDLYSLGCVAFQLLVGRVPFGHGLPPMAAAYAHIVGQRAPFEPRVHVPSGLEAWLDGMLSVRAGERYARAADAAAALADLGDEDAADERSASLALALKGDAERTTLSVDAAELPTLALEEITTLPPGQDLATGDLPTVREPTSAAPPIPPDWRRPTPPPPPLELIGAGLSLFGLRSVPVVGRGPERDELWAALKQVSASGQTRAVLLEGPAGSGKSCLARWLGERSHEVGAAHVVRVVHGELPNPADGLAAALARHLGTVGLTRAAARERLTQRLGGARAPREVLALLSGEDRSFRFEHPVERWAAAAHLLERLSIDRPVVLWLDDLQWGPDAARAAAWLLQRPEGLRLLIVATVRTEARGDRPDAAAALADLDASPACRAMQIGPLSDDVLPELVRGLLPVERALVRRLADRVAGNPLFAVHLLADLVHRDQLVVGPAGAFGLRSASHTALPTAVQEVWRGRLDHLEADRPDGQRVALELAAVFGADVDPREWGEACKLAGVEPSSALVEDLAAAGLATAGADGNERGRWAFGHPLLAETIRSRAGERGVLADRHAIAAAVLESGEAPDPARLGEHLLAAGRPREAASWLLTSVRAARARTEYGRAFALLDRYREALDRGGDVGPSPQRFRYLALLASLSRSRGDFPAALAAIGQARANATDRGDRGDLAQALSDEARTLLNTGDYAACEALLEEALTLVEGQGRPAVRATALRFLGAVRMFSGDLAGAEAPLRAAGEQFDALPDQSLAAAYCRLLLAQRAKQIGDFAASERRLAEASDRFAASGSRLGQAECANARGELARLQEDLATAERFYREALTAWEALDSIDTAIARANLGLVLTVQGKFADAKRILEAARQRFAAEGRDDLTACAEISLLTPAAAARDWAAWDRLLPSALAALDRCGLVYLDVAREAERAAERAWHAGSVARAKRAWDLSARQYRALHRAEDAARVEARQQQ